ncbi:MAG: Maf family protein, partial [Firmicutes bacterium]|nr:Maf family protein [Bacillota bacterium]
MFILASASPRRIEMLRDAGYDPVVKPASIIENLPFDMAPETATMYLALSKAMAVADKAGSGSSKDWAHADEEITI